MRGEEEGGKGGENGGEDRERREEGKANAVCMYM